MYLTYGGNFLGEEGYSSSSCSHKRAYASTALFLEGFLISHCCCNNVVSRFDSSNTSPGNRLAIMEETTRRSSIGQRCQPHYRVHPLGNGSRCPRAPISVRTHPGSTLLPSHWLRLGEAG